jgi:tRNA pseudouridine synthase 10
VFLISLSWLRDELVNLKAGEEKTIKRYMALCISSDPIEAQSLEQLGDIKDLTLSQKTPVRVLHRRPLATRPKIVHSMKAWLLENPTKLCKKGKCMTGFIYAALFY